VKISGLMEGTDFALLADFYRLMRVYMRLIGKSSLSAEEAVYLAGVEDRVVTQG
jgi:hypothetical protein